MILITNNRSISAEVYYTVAVSENAVTSVTQDIFKKFDKVWSYAGKSLLTTRHILNTVTRSCRWIALSCRTHESLRAVVLRLKLFSIVSVPLTLLALPGAARKIWNNIQWNDGKGIVLSTLSFSILTADTFDSLTTFVNAALTLASKSTVGWMSTLGMPLTAGIIGMGSIVRSVKLIDLQKLIQETQELSKTGSEIKLKLFIKSNLENVHRQTAFERKSSSKAIAILKSIAKLEDGDKIAQNNHLNRLVSTLKTERLIQVGYLSSNLISAVALTVFSLPAPPVLPFILLTCSMLTRITMQSIQDFS